MARHQCDTVYGKQQIINHFIHIIYIFLIHVASIVEALLTSVGESNSQSILAVALSENKNSILVLKKKVKVHISNFTQKYVKKFFF